MKKKKNVFIPTYTHADLKKIRRKNPGVTSTDWLYKKKRKRTEISDFATERWEASLSEIE